jgi:hypothetical protein
LSAVDVLAAAHGQPSAVVPMIVLNCLVVFSLEKVEKMVPPFTAAALG